MGTTFWVMAMKPLLMFGVLIFICLPVRYAARRWLPPGELRDILLTDLVKRRERLTAQKKAENEIRKAASRIVWRNRGAAFGRWIRRHWMSMGY